MYILNRFAFSGPMNNHRPAFLYLFILLMILAPLPALSQPNAVGSAEKAVDVVTGSSGANSAQSTENPYNNRETPKSFKGWADYILDLITES